MEAPLWLPEELEDIAQDGGSDGEQIASSHPETTGEQEVEPIELRSIDGYTKRTQVFEVDGSLSSYGEAVLKTLADGLTLVQSAQAINERGSFDVLCTKEDIGNDRSSLYHKYFKSSNGAHAVAQAFAKGLFAAEEAAEMEERPKLTQIERNIVLCIALGLVRSKIAVYLDIDEEQIAPIVKGMLAKFKATNDANLVYKILMGGTISLEDLKEGPQKMEIPFSKPLRSTSSVGLARPTHHRRPSRGFDFEAATERADQDGKKLGWQLRAGILIQDNRIELSPEQQKVLEALAGGILVERVVAITRIPEKTIEAWIDKGYDDMKALALQKENRNLPKGRGSTKL